MANLIQNLTSADPAAAGAERCAVNVGQSERIASAVTGGLMVLYGLSKKSPGGVLIAGIGGAVAYRGVSGHCGLYQKLGISTVDADEAGRTPKQKLNRHGVHVEVAFTVDKPRQELYAFWRDFTNLPKFM